MDIFEFADILTELYPPPPGYDPMEEYYRIKEEDARKYWSLSPEEREKFYDYSDDVDDDLDGPGLDIENLTREELIKILKEDDRREEAKKSGKNMYPIAYEHNSAGTVLEVAEPPVTYGESGGSP